MSEQNRMPDVLYIEKSGNGSVYVSQRPSARYTPYLRNDYGDDGVVVRRSFGVDEMHAASNRIAELEAIVDNMATQYGCTCGHPACKRCQDTQDARAALEKASKS